MTDAVEVEKELLVMLESTDPLVRVRGARGLLRPDPAYATDRSLAERLLTAAENERCEEPPAGEHRDSWLPSVLGELVARIVVSKTATWERARALMHTQPLTDLRVALIRHFLVWNEHEDEVYDTLEALVADPQAEVRVGVLDALQLDPVTNFQHQERLFRFFCDNLTSSDPNVASKALQNLGGWISERADLFDVFLEHMRARKDETVPYRCIFGVARLLDANAPATDVQRAKAVTIATAIARNPANGHDRILVLKGIRDHDAVGGRALLTDLKKDPDKAVAKEAKSLLK